MFDSLRYHLFFEFKVFDSLPIFLLQASVKICQKVFESKQWEECLLNTLANPDHEITLRGVVVIHNMILVRTTDTVTGLNRIMRSRCEELSSSTI
jgi:hypothetical protein